MTITVLVFLIRVVVGIVLVLLSANASGPLALAGFLCSAWHIIGTALFAAGFRANS